MDKKEEFDTLRDEILKAILKEYSKSKTPIELPPITSNILNMLINLDRRMEELKELVGNLNLHLNLLEKHIINDKKELLKEIKEVVKIKKKY